MPPGAILEGRHKRIGDAASALTKFHSCNMAPPPLFLLSKPSGTSLHVWLQEVLYMGNVGRGVARGDVGQHGARRRGP
eukprot:scaffold201045_cov30-Tisochrysis_lutea.AAC.1